MICRLHSFRADSINIITIIKSSLIIYIVRYSSLTWISYFLPAAHCPLTVFAFFASFSPIFFYYVSYNYYLLSCTRWEFIFYITIVDNLISENAIHDKHEYKASSILGCLMFNNGIWSIILLQANLVTNEIDVFEYKIFGSLNEDPTQYFERQHANK